MAISQADVRRFAPFVFFHPKERFFVMDPTDFVAQSRFRHFRAFGRDQGYNIRERRWVTTDSHSNVYYGPPMSVLAAFSAWKNNENRRPRDSNRGDHWNVFLQPDGELRGNRNPSGNVPAFYYSCAVDTARLPAATRRRFSIKNECYERITYWWFNGYNDGPAGGAIQRVDNHQGDWEHITVKIRAGRLLGVYFAQHGEAYFVPRSKLRLVGGRPEVYSALGSHASYPRTGRFSLMGGVSDETDHGGVAWDTSQALASLRRQPWRHYAGAWGEVGELTNTTGPLGPWYKRHRK